MARLLLTRPTEDNVRLAGLLREQGHDVLEMPVFTIRPRADALPDLDGVHALLFTSKNGVRAFCQNSPRRDLPVYAVGESCARAASDAGFSRVTAAGGDVHSLAQAVMAAEKPQNGPLLHLAGADLAGDLAGELVRAGYAVQRTTLYAAEPISMVPDAAAAALSHGQLDAVLLFSPRTARVLCDLLARSGLSAASAALRAFCLSPSVAAAAAALPWKSVVTCAEPTESALLATLHRDLK